MDNVVEVSVNILWVKHILWIVATLIWLGVNYFQKKETGYLSGLGALFRFGVSTMCYLGFWIIWLILF